MPYRLTEIPYQAFPAPHAMKSCFHPDFGLW